MRIRIIILGIIYLISSNIVFADKLPQPPVLKDEPLSEQQYLRDIYNNWNNLEEVTTNPDGSRRGNYRDMVLLKTGGNYYVEICVSSPSGTTWLGILLTDTP